MTIFEWNQFNGSNAKISRYVQGFRCRTTNIVAYYIPNKHNVNENLDFIDEYGPLKNNYGIYFLLGEASDNEKSSIYIGQASTRDNTKGLDRIKEHINLRKDWYRDKWDSVLYVTSTDNSWSTGLLDTLEFLFIELFRKKTEYQCLNSKRGTFGNITDNEFKTELTAITELLALPLFGYNVIDNAKSISDTLHDNLIKVIYEMKDELKEELKSEYLSKYSPEDIEKLEWIKRVESYNSFKSSIQFAKSSYLFGDRILFGSKKEIVTPEYIAKQMVDLIPAEVFNSKAKILDVACKSGVFLKCLIDRFMSDDEELPINHEIEYKDKHVRLQNLVQNQLCGLCLSDHGYLVSNYTVIDTVQKYENKLIGDQFNNNIMNSIVDLPNITRINGYQSMLKNDDVLKGDQHQTLREEIKNKFDLHVKDGEELTFDVVMGNPPYNDDDYLDFVNFGHKISSKYTVMITPAQWQSKAGQKNEAFRREVVPYMKEVVYYPDCLDVFAAQVSSGVCYYLIDKTAKTDKCKVTNSSVMKPCIDSVEYRDIKLEQTLWNCGNAIVNKVQNTVGYKNYCISKVEVKKKYTVNLNKQITKATGTSGCWDWKNSCIRDDWVGKGGVLFTENGTLVLPIPKIITDKVDKSSGTSINVFTSDDEAEIKSYLSWIKTKFVRFLILINIGSLTMMNQRGWRFVPDPGVFDHIFTDKELYEKYNLTDEEIKIIESTIKELK